MHRLDIVGEAEIAVRLGVKPNTVHQWVIRELLPEPEGTVSGRRAWRWTTIQEWADRTGRTPQLRERILAILRDAGPGTTSEVTATLAGQGWVHPSATAQVWRVLNDLHRDGEIGIQTHNRWFVAQSPLWDDAVEIKQPVVGGNGQVAPLVASPPIAAD